MRTAAVMTIHSDAPIFSAFFNSALCLEPIPFSSGSVGGCWLGGLLDPDPNSHRRLCSFAGFQGVAGMQRRSVCNGRRCSGMVGAVCCYRTRKGPSAEPGSRAGALWWGGLRWDVHLSFFDRFCLFLCSAEFC